MTRPRPVIGKGVLVVKRCFRDFVCGIGVGIDESAASYDYQGSTYHFCSEACRDDFSQDPPSYVSDAWMYDI